MWLISQMTLLPIWMHYMDISLKNCRLPRILWDSIDSYIIHAKYYKVYYYVIGQISLSSKRQCDLDMLNHPLLL